ncbi:hypothetical protein [Streptomyces sp. NPDC001404]|uniref:hypothetical protein n=1 Tax=Streptomyces sp. NPDC001404 TaxID=3364571 RepID=UPI00369187A1
MNSPLHDKPADPRVFGPEYDPRDDPQSARCLGSLQADDVAAMVTVCNDTPPTPLIVGRARRGKTSVDAVLRQIILAGRRRDLAVDVQDGKTRLQHALIQKPTRLPHAPNCD